MKQNKQNKKKKKTKREEVGKKKKHEMINIFSMNTVGTNGMAVEWSVVVFCISNARAYK